MRHAVAYQTHTCQVHKSPVYFLILYRSDDSVFYDDQLDINIQISHTSKCTNLITKMGRIFIEFVGMDKGIDYYSIRRETGALSKLWPSHPAFVICTTVGIVNQVLKTYFKSIETDPDFNDVRHVNKATLGSCYGKV